MSEFRYRDVPSSQESNEAEPGPQTEVVVHFLRHEDKESKPPEGGTEPDIELTTVGRRHALETAREKPAGIGIAAGSERVRSGHTALLRLEGAKGFLTEEMTAAEAKAAVDAELKVGSKLTQLPELTFAYQGSPEYNEQFMAQFKGGHALEFILHNRVCRIPARPPTTPRSSPANGACPGRSTASSARTRRSMRQPATASSGTSVRTRPSLNRSI